MALIRELEKLSAEQQKKFEQFSKLLVFVNKTHNLTRISDPAQIKLRHFEDSLACLPVLRAWKVEDKSLIDIGSGAGLPGIALAIALPDWKVVCVEATGKKATFLQQVKEELGLENLTIMSERAEVLVRRVDFREQFSLVTARALANMSVLSELCLGFVRPKGKLIAWKGAAAQEETAKATKAFHRLGGSCSDMVAYATGEGLDCLTLVVVDKTTSTPIKYPRPFQTIKKTPL